MLQHLLLLLPRLYISNLPFLTLFSRPLDGIILEEFFFLLFPFYIFVTEDMIKVDLETEDMIKVDLETEDMIKVDQKRM